MERIKKLLEKILISEAPIPTDIRKEALEIRDMLRKNVAVLPIIDEPVKFDGREYVLNELRQVYNEAENSTEAPMFKIAFIKAIRINYNIGLKEAKELSDYLQSDFDFHCVKV